MSMAPRVERSTAIEKLKNRNNKLEIQGCISEALYNLSDFISYISQWSLCQIQFYFHCRILQINICNMLKVGNENVKVWTHRNWTPYTSRTSFVNNWILISQWYFKTNTSTFPTAAYAELWSRRNKIWQII
jgi:hypothetical protein